MTVKGIRMNAVGTVAIFDRSLAVIELETLKPTYMLESLPPFLPLSHTSAYK